MAEVDVQPVAVPTSTPDSALPRKRRRRVPASGASDDCFTCRKRHTKCDRKRPYCSQCLEMGKDCSGYRTTLTWGVGVASRGKLRGMSLPIPRKTSPAPTSDPTSKARGNSLDTSARRRTQQHSQPSSAPTSSPSPPRSSVDQGQPGYARISPPQTVSLPLASPLPAGWPPHAHAAAFMSPALMPDLPGKRLKPQGLHRLITSKSLYDDALSSAPSSVGSASPSYADSSYNSPLDYPSTPEHMCIPDRLHSVYGDSPVGSFVDELAYYGALGSPSLSLADDISSIASSDPSILDSLDGSYSEPLFNFGNPLDFPQPLLPSPPSDMSLMGPNVQFLAGPPKDGQMVSPQPIVSPTSVEWNNSSPFGLAPRVQYLLDFYDKEICPIMVAFDGPSNPYRLHVLPLAAHSPALHNAVAALALNNIRKRVATGQSTTQVPLDPTSTLDEEQHYKQLSVQLLDTQLKHPDPNVTADDSVLVTLLILCLYHVCDSGISHFKTQLAGVQKLLAIRHSHNPSGAPSDVLDWVQLYFAWFDVMTATVNDREIEFDLSMLDLGGLSSRPAALHHFEDLTGCDWRLFRLIARLGRLNLLAQGLPVKRSAANFQSMLTSLHGTGDTPDLTATVELTTASLGYAVPKSSSPPDYYSMNGGEFSLPLGSPDSLGSGSGKPDIPTPAASDERHDFWAEWKEVRERLQAWEREPPATLYSPQASSMQRDFFHLSEAYRYAALLYIERLAYPSLPSSSLKLQNLVAQGLYHISEIAHTSAVTKFLLWPLFILGTECSDITHRALVREKALVIHAGSAFQNNLAAVGVLERVWARADAGALSGSVPEQISRPTLFAWRTDMMDADGEYIII